MGTLQDTINDDYKKAMIARDKKQRDAIQLLRAEIKRREVDQRKTLTDDDIVKVLTSMVKQRQDSASQYQNAGRQDLMDQEQFEISVLKTYMPAELSEDEIDAIINTTLSSLEATDMSAMSKVMSALRPQLQGRADMGKVSQRIKALLSA